MTLGRSEIKAKLRHAFEAMDLVNAMWFGGSDAFEAADGYSDVDVQLDVADGGHLRVFELAEQLLEELGGVAQILQVPEPAWHGHHQRFYRLENASPFTLIDLVCMERSSTASRFNELEIHGRYPVIFDRLGVAKQIHADPDAHRKRIQKQLQHIVGRFFMFHCFVNKELRRGHPVGALSFYRSLVLEPLVKLLRTRHCPWRHDWGSRYLMRDLPPEVYAEVRYLSFVIDAKDLAAKYQRAVERFEDELKLIDIDVLELPVAEIKLEQG